MSEWKTIKKKCAASLLIMSISGCSSGEFGVTYMSEYVIQAAKAEIPEPCLTNFMNYRFYESNVVARDNAFALSKNGNFSACAYAIPGDEIYPEPENIAQRAIYRCEILRRLYSQEIPCSLFTENFQLVWAPPPPPSPAPLPPQNPITQGASGGAIDDAKEKCADLGFKRGTPKFGECVLKLTR